MVKEESILYKERRIKSPGDESVLLKQFLGEVDREYFIVLCLDTKNQPTAINVCHIGSLNTSIFKREGIYLNHMEKEGYA